MVVLLVVTPEEWLVIGLQSVGFDPIRQNRCHETNIERFLAHFGASPGNSLCDFFRSADDADRSSSDCQAKHSPFPHDDVLAENLPVRARDGCNIQGRRKDSPNSSLEVRSCHPSTQGTKGKCHWTFSPFADTPSHTFCLSCSLYLFY